MIVSSGIRRDSGVLSLRSCWLFSSHYCKRGDVLSERGGGIIGSVVVIGIIIVFNVLSLIFGWGWCIY